MNSSRSSITVEESTTEFEQLNKEDETEKPSTLRKKRKLCKDDDNTIAETLQILKDCASQKNDRYESFAHHVADELRELDGFTYTLVKKDILNIIFEEKMGKYRQATAQSTNNPLESSYGSRDFLNL